MEKDNPLLAYFNDSDGDTGCRLKSLENLPASELVQETGSPGSRQKDARNVINCEYTMKLNKLWEDRSNPHYKVSMNERLTQLIGSYKEGEDWLNLCPLGYGKFGHVTLVYDKKRKCICATKKVSKEYYRHEEFEIWKNLNALDIVQLFGAVCHEDSVTFFMELVNGGTLGELIKRKVWLCHTLAIKYFSMILNALDYLHRCNILHNDVKGDNILLSDTDQRLLLCDFTFAKRLSPGQLTPEGDPPVGTQTHMAPEVVLSTGHDHRADVWSATCTLLHMINGRQPWLKRFGNKRCLYFVIAEKSPPYFEIPSSCHILVDHLIKQGLTVEKYKRPFAGNLREEADLVLAEITGLQHVFGEQYTEVATKPCPEHLWATLEYSTNTAGIFEASIPAYVPSSECEKNTQAPENLNGKRPQEQTEENIIKNPPDSSEAVISTAFPASATVSKTQSLALEMRELYDSIQYLLPANFREEKPIEFKSTGMLPSPQRDQDLEQFLTEVVTTKTSEKINVIQLPFIE